MRERTYDHRCLHTRIYAFVLKYLSSEAKLGGAPDRVRANGGGETYVRDVGFYARSLRSIGGARLYKWLVARSVCAACLCFVPRDYLVCSIAFVVYIHGWTIYILYAGLMPVCVSRRSRISVYVRVPSISGLSLSLSFYLSPTLHHRDFVIPRFLRQCMRRRKRSCAEVSVALGESNVSLARLLQVISRLADSQ